MQFFYVIYVSAQIIAMLNGKLEDTGAMYVDKIIGYSQTSQGAYDLMQKVMEHRCAGNKKVLWIEDDGEARVENKLSFSYIMSADNDGWEYGRTYYLRSEPIPFDTLILP